MHWLRERGQICAFAVNSNLLPPMVKNRLCSFACRAVVSLRRPVVPSVVPPVKFWYLLKALLAMSMSVVPVSTIPAVFPRMVAPEDPYVVPGRLVYAPAGLRW